MLNLVANGPSGYNLTRSLRFRSSASAYLSRTPASATNQQKYTWSGWVKRGALGVRGSLFGSVDTYIEFIASDIIEINLRVSTTNYIWTTSQVFRDPSAWYHIVWAIDTTQAVATDRMKLYVNGVQVTSFALSATIPQNSTTRINSATLHTIGSYNATTDYLDGYQTEVNFIDGQQLTPSSFGSTNSLTGVWQPAKYTGTYGTNGFYLPFTDNSALTTSSNAGLGKDFSGNSNYWVTNNISITSGTTYDSMTDVPTLTSATAANYCVLNPLLGDSLDLPKDGNLKVGGTNDNYSVGTIAFPISGKFYAEATVTAYSSGQIQIGICPANAKSNLGNDATAYLNSGATTKNNVSSTTLSSYTQGDIIGITVDVDNSTVQFYKNNTAQTALTSVLRISDASFFTYMNISSSIVNFNFGQRPFSYTPPTGYVALNTYNLPTSTIVKGNTVMDATLYTGTGSIQSITNAAGFKPDLVWTKSRSSGTLWHNLVDSVRGITKTLFSNSTSAEDTTTNIYSSFNSNGFSVGTDTSANSNGATFVGWQWQAGQGTTSSNTNGSITSTVSVNATAGFSIVSYTGTGANATVGHGLGVAPKMIFIKQRSGGTQRAWQVYHVSMGNGGGAYLNQTNAYTADSTAFNNTSPTSSVFSLGSSVYPNQSGSPIVAYCWAEIAGFSKFGSYTGNGSADGVFNYLGFQPKYILIKQTNTTDNWVAYDSTRNPYNYGSICQLSPNLSDAETVASTNDLDILSNGFKLRSSNTRTNGSGGTYIYACFASNPFKNSNAF